MSKEKKGAQTIRCVKKTPQGLNVVYLSEKTVRNSKFMEKYGIRVEDESYRPGQNKTDQKVNQAFREMPETADEPQFAAVASEPKERKPRNNTKTA